MGPQGLVCKKQIWSVDSRPEQNVRFIRTKPLQRSVNIHRQSRLVRLVAYTIGLADRQFGQKWESPGRGQSRHVLWYIALRTGCTYPWTCLSCPVGCTLQLRHNGRDGVSNHQPRHLCDDQRKHQNSVLLAICAGNSPVTGEFLARMVSNAEKFLFDNVIIPFHESGRIFSEPD